MTWGPRESTFKPIISHGLEQHTTSTYSAGIKSLVASLMTKSVDPAGIVPIPFPTLEGPISPTPVDVGMIEFKVGVTAIPPA
jgi:hypothetical protein